MESRTKDNMIAVLTDELEKKDIVVGALTKQVAAMKLCMDQQHRRADALQKELTTEADALKKKLAAAQDDIQEKG